MNNAIAKFPCGCEVTFVAKTGYRTSKFNACQDHNAKEFHETRNQMVYAAKNRLVQHADGVHLDQLIGNVFGR